LLDSTTEKVITKFTKIHCPQVEILNAPLDLGGQFIKVPPCMSTVPRGGATVGMRYM